ncbi:MAG: hypothetical protein ACOYMR_15570, partial [Ilumatobacteraceae bacterium]
EEFWSFLAVRYFWEFISLRQNAAWKKTQGEAVDADIGDSDKEKLERYIRGKDHYQLPLRMYLRAQAVDDEGDHSLTEINGGGTDFWRSQVLGVRTASYPALARSVARAQDAAGLNVDEQRRPGRRVNRLRVNIEFFMHTDDEAEAIITPLWVVTPQDEIELEAQRAQRQANQKARTSKKSGAKKAAPAKKATAAKRVTPAKKAAIAKKIAPAKAAAAKKSTPAEKTAN